MLLSLASTPIIYLKKILKHKPSTKSSKKVNVDLRI